MLTIRYPYILAEIAEMPMGLCPLIFNDGGCAVLAIKAPKEAILAAKINQGFSCYLVPSADGKKVLSLMTAFFDDPRNPFHIWTPLVGDEMTNALFHLLASESFDVHFFDENNRELLGYRATCTRAASVRSRVESAQFWPFSLESARRVHDESINWFVNRTPRDDEEALEIRFGEALVPEDIVIQDLRTVKFHGSSGSDITFLERDREPGKFQEMDIVKLLQRVFPEGQIYLNPFKEHDGKELVDVLVASTTNILLIQAKDSPNTEPMLQRPIERKMKTIEAHLSKAVSQLRGALSHVRANEQLSLVTGQTRHCLPTRDRQVWGLIVVKELFNSEYGSYSPPVLSLARDTGVPCLLLDFSELHNYTHHRRTERELFSTFQETFNFAITRNQFPRSRFGLKSPAEDS